MKTRQDAINKYKYKCQTIDMFFPYAGGLDSALFTG